MEPVLAKILIATGISVAIALIGWFSRNYLNNIVNSFKDSISNLGGKVDKVLEIQKKQEIATVQIKMELDNVKDSVNDIKRHVDGHTEKIHNAEVKLAEIAQWKKDKEQGV